MRKICLTLLTLSGVVLFTDTAFSDELAAANLRGLDEVPVISSPGTARFNATIDETAGAINWTMSYSNLNGNITQSDLRFAQEGVNGGNLVFLCSNVASPGGIQACPLAPATISGTIRSREIIGNFSQGTQQGDFGALLRAIKGGIIYVNIHTDQYPSGEIRGQMVFSVNAHDAEVDAVFDSLNRIGASDPTLPGVRSLRELSAANLGQGLTPSDINILMGALYLEAARQLHATTSRPGPVREADVKSVLSRPIDTSHYGQRYFNKILRKTKVRLARDPVFRERLKEAQVSAAARRKTCIAGPRWICAVMVVIVVIIIVVVIIAEQPSPRPVLGKVRSARSERFAALTQAQFLESIRGGVPLDVRLAN